jgi:hypothetical protein
MLLRRLNWNIRRGSRTAVGVAGQYEIHKRWGKPGYALQYATAGRVQATELLGTHSTYAKAEAAADSHNQTLVSAWHSTPATPLAVQDAAKLVMEWDGFIDTLDQPLLRAARTLAAYITQTQVK